MSTISFISFLHLLAGGYLYHQQFPEKTPLAVESLDAPDDLQLFRLRHYLVQREVVAFKGDGYSRYVRIVGGRNGQGIYVEPSSSVKADHSRQYIGLIVHVDTDYFFLHGSSSYSNSMSSIVLPFGIIGNTLSFTAILQSIHTGPSNLRAFSKAAESSSMSFTLKP